MDMEKLYQVIANIFVNEKKRVNFQEIEIKLQPLCGLSNSIYLVNIVEKENQKLIKEFVYKVFGENNEFMDRPSEEKIMENLSMNNLGPQILLSDKTSFRAEEFVKSSDLCMSKQLEDNIINQVIRILVSYSMISCVHSYKVFSDQFNTEYNIKINKGNSFSEDVKKNIYDLATKSMFNKAKKNFQKFSGKFKERFDKVLNSKIFLEYKKIKHYLSHYKEIFSHVMPKEGLFVLNHNDVHRLNFLTLQDDRLMLIDHEYAALNLIGIDIVNYLIETGFNYKAKGFPFFEHKEVLDYEKMYDMYLSYLNVFEENYRSREETNEETESLFNNCRTKKYFLQLICVISLFWFIYSIIYLDWSVF
jgi:thiamine kinase-like enzyme